VINKRFHKYKAPQTLAQHTVGPPDAKWSFEAFFDHGRNADDTKCNKPITSKGLTPQKTDPPQSPLERGKSSIFSLSKRKDSNPPLW
jgi:hypothetical protein